jgi:hypothetical protein
MMSEGLSVSVDKLLAIVLQTDRGITINDVREKQICALWASYGAISRITVKICNSEEKEITFIHKSVKPPIFPRSDIGHVRKITSYINEVKFYQTLSQKFLVERKIPMPMLYLAEISSSFCSLLMSDLSICDFPIENLSQLNRTQTSTALRWLSRFHAAGMDYGLHGHGLHREGSYWYLDTRRDEWDAMGPEWSRLKVAAAAISDRLKPLDVLEPGYTIIHGDFKSANLLFSSNSLECAGIDFQYTGGGYCARDLAMFIVCAVGFDDDSLRSGLVREQEILKEYFSFLSEALAVMGQSESSEIITFDVIQNQYELALMDLVRFMAGWGLWGNVGYACARTRELLSKLDGEVEDAETSVFTSDDYREAILKRYPR